MSNRTALTTQRSQTPRPTRPFLMALGVAIASLTILSLGLQAQERDNRRLGELNNGMSLYDVLQAWGPPDDKQQAEAKKQETWRYGSGKVIFQDGKVVAWIHPQEGYRSATEEPSADAIVKDSVTAAPPSGTHRAVVEEILGEILSNKSEAGN